jgi:hypothetical protein
MTNDHSGNHEQQPEKASWNAHYLLTRTALASMSNESFEGEVRVTSLDDFVTAARRELPQVMGRYVALLAKKTGAEPAESPPPEIRTAHDLVEALRLNPQQPLRYVGVKSPDDNPHSAAHDPSREGPPGGSYVETAIGDRMTVLDVLCVYADEPDWGMDQGVFAVERYGLGEPPFGGKTGKSSQASFHMAFFHEIPLLNLLFPRVRKTFLDMRSGTFLALARLALDRHMDYWGWRFAAWAVHYLQDLTQPYHANFLPFPLWMVLGRFLLNPRPASFVDRNKNLLMNRHILCEAVVHLWLNDAVKKHVRHPFLTALEGKGECAGGTLNEVVRESAKMAAEKAFRVNRGLEKILNDPLLDDPTYFVLNDPPYPLIKRLADASALRPEVIREWTDLLSTCLVQTGKVTRYMVREVGR